MNEVFDAGSSGTLRRVIGMDVYDDTGSNPGTGNYVRIEPDADAGPDESPVQVSWNGDGVWTLSLERE